MLKDGVEDNDLIKFYHNIILYEIKKLSNSNSTVEGELYGLMNTNYCIGVNELNSLASKASMSQDVVEELMNRGFLIPVNNKCYRSIHMDILIRSSDIRVSPRSSKMTLSTFFSYATIPTSSSKDRIILPDKTSSIDVARELYNKIYSILGEYTNIFTEVMKEYFNSRGSKGYDFYQAYALIKALEEWNKNSFVVIAPTGAGKTEIFLSLMIIKLLSDIFKEKRSKQRYIIMYPRKMLEVDQASRIIQLTSILNKHIANYGKKVYVYVRDGDTSKLEDSLKESSEDRIEFRGISCGGGGKLYILKHNGKVICDENKEIMDFVLPLKDVQVKEVNYEIVLTNMETLIYRLSSQEDKDIDVCELKNTSMLIIDEAHEYDSIRLAFLSYIIETIRVLANSNIKIIISSATLSNPVDFANKLTNSNDTVDLTFNTIIKQYNINFSSERLILTLFVQMHPRYSWMTYISEWAAFLGFLNMLYKESRFSFNPQSIIFINNIREINRTFASIRNALSLGSPLDNLCVRRYECKELNPLEHKHILKHYIYLNKKVFDTISNYMQKFDDTKYANMYEILVPLYDIVFSEVPLNKRNIIYEKLKKGSLAIVLATSSLELGMDYPNVAFIVNVGFDREDSLIQRIGRGGRSSSTLNTVLAIIVARNNPLDYRMFSNRKRLNTIASMSSMHLPVKNISKDLISIKILATLRLAIAYALGNYCEIILTDRDKIKFRGTSIVGPDNIPELIKFLSDVISERKLKDIIINRGFLSEEEYLKLVEELKQAYNIYTHRSIYINLESILNVAYSILENLDNLAASIQNIVESSNKMLEYVKKIKDININKIGFNIEIIDKTLMKILTKIEELSNNLMDLSADYEVGAIESLRKDILAIRDTVSEMDDMLVKLEGSLNNVNLLIKTAINKIIEYNITGLREPLEEYNTLLVKSIKNIEDISKLQRELISNINNSELV